MPALILLWQDVMPTSGDEPWPWLSGILVLGIGALWLWFRERDKSSITREQAVTKELMDELRGRCSRSETKTDKLTEDAAKQADVIRELTNAILRATSLTEASVAATKDISDRLDTILAMLDSGSQTRRRS